MRTALALAWAAMFLQIAVFLQPLLPEKYQIAPVCETIVSALHLQQHQPLDMQHNNVSAMSNMLMHDSHEHSSDMMQMSVEKKSAHQHDPQHECIYCTVYGHVVASTDIDLSEVVDRIQVRLLAFQHAFKHIYFVLQRLFLLPQGRAPPLFA
ncbi:MAG: DUF2946 domain-containing protein [Acinetobacter sp.]